MTLRTTAAAYDPLTQTEWRDTIATMSGIAYSGIGSTKQAELNRFIEETMEFMSQRFGHEPWAQREWSETLASGTATFQMDADVRHVLVIVETDGTTTRNVTPTTKREYLEAWGTGSTTHPWNEQGRPMYFFDGMDDTDPPQQQWRRVPTPDTAYTLTVLGRPYFGLIATDSYTEIPANAVAAMREHLLAKWKRYLGDYQEAAAHTAAREDEITALNMNDNVEGAWEVGRLGQPPADFAIETEGP